MATFSRTLLAIALLASLVLASTASAELVELNPGNYKAIVKDPKKDVFVMFYAPWCGHCNSMKPAWKALADGFPSNGDIVIARLDASQHREIGEENGVTGFPTLIFFPKHNKKGVEYSGPREANAFKSFIKTHQR